MAEPKRVEWKPDPNIFGATFLAALETNLFPGGTEQRLTKLKDAWHAHRLFVEWVSAGTDEADHAARLAFEKEQVERVARQKAEDEAAETERQQKQRAAWAAQ